MTEEINNGYIGVFAYGKNALSEIERMTMFDYKVHEPNEIKYQRISVGKGVRRIVFADGTVFVREEVD